MMPLDEIIAANEARTKDPQRPVRVPLSFRTQHGGSLHEAWQIIYGTPPLQTSRETPQIRAANDKKESDRADATSHQALRA